MGRACRCVQFRVARLVWSISKRRGRSAMAYGRLLTDCSPDEKGKKLPIFSVHVHPDNSRLATGGLGLWTRNCEHRFLTSLVDAKIKIWSTLPILSAEADEDEANYKLLCTMTTHNGISPSSKVDQPADTNGRIRPDCTVGPSRTIPCEWE